MFGKVEGLFKELYLTYTNKSRLQNHNSKMAIFVQSNKGK